MLQAAPVPEAERQKRAERAGEVCVNRIQKIILLGIITMVLASYAYASFSQIPTAQNKHGCIFTGISEKGLNQWDCRNAMNYKFMIIYESFGGQNFKMMGFIIYNGT